MKVMHLAARRVGDLGSRLDLTPEVIRDAYALIEHVVYEQTNLMYNRHVDQIILACHVRRVQGRTGRLVNRVHCSSRISFTSTLSNRNRMRIYFGPW
jgi:hypothetical protein